MQPDTSTAAGRFTFVLQKIWGGSQTRMARDIGISQPMISRIVNGEQSPGRRVLEKLAAHPLIDAAWLLSGTGEPFATSLHGQVERALYIAQRPFVGLPADHPECLGGMREVSTRLYRPSRYWVHATAGHPLTCLDRLSIVAGDFVLFEADSSAWPEDLSGLPCLIADKPSEKLEFRQIRASHGVDKKSVVEVTGDPPVKTESQRRVVILNDEPLGARTHDKPEVRTEKRRRRDVAAVGIYREGMLGQLAHRVFG